MGWFLRVEGSHWLEHSFVSDESAGSEWLATVDHWLLEVTFWRNIQHFFREVLGIANWWKTRSCACLLEVGILKTWLNIFHHSWGVPLRLLTDFSTSLISWSSLRSIMFFLDLFIKILIADDIVHHFRTLHMYKFNRSSQRYISSRRSTSRWYHFSSSFIIIRPSTQVRHSVIDHGLSLYLSQGPRFNDSGLNFGLKL